MTNLVNFKVQPSKKPVIWCTNQMSWVFGRSHKKIVCFDSVQQSADNSAKSVKSGLRSLSGDDVLPTRRDLTKKTECFWKTEGRRTFQKMLWICYISSVTGLEKLTVGFIVDTCHCFMVRTHFFFFWFDLIWRWKTFLKLSNWNYYVDSKIGILSGLNFDRVPVAMQS